MHFAHLVRPCWLGHSACNPCRQGLATAVVCLCLASRVQSITMNANRLRKCFWEASSPPHPAGWGTPPAVTPSLCTQLSCLPRNQWHAICKGGNHCEASNHCDCWFAPVFNILQQMHPMSDLLCTCLSPGFFAAQAISSRLIACGTQAAVQAMTQILHMLYDLPSKFESVAILGHVGANV